MVSVIPPPGPTTPDFSGCRALVVEPDPPNRRLLSHMLTSMGVGHLEGCSTIRDAWRSLAEDRFNVLFLDWSSELDAVAFLKALRSLSNPHRMLPVVVTTGFVEGHYLSRLAEAGVNEVVLKPYCNETVGHRLASLLHDPRMFIHCDSYFGPDRRRRRLPFDGPERRAHQNWRGTDRRRETGDPPGGERRQGWPGYVPADRRASPRGPLD
ncbi:MAG: response regulator [Pseudomonadota bacterium]